MARKVENIAWMVPNIVALRAFLSLMAIVVTTISALLILSSSNGRQNRAATYGAAALLLGAISPGETRYMEEMIKRSGVS